MSFIIAPGTGPCADATFENAFACMAQLVVDANLVKTWCNPKEHDKRDGRFAFEVIDQHGRQNSVLMPGWPVESVRYRIRKQNCLYFPRLYINGSSFLWKYVVELLLEKDEEE